MLDPQERTVFLDSLAPPEGFILDEAIGTTYSLDLISLVSLPLAFTLFEQEDAQGQPTSNTVLLLEALRRHIDRLTIFAQAGRISIPSQQSLLFGYLEGSVVQVIPGHADGVFHPKLWALRFHNQETNEVRYRLLCLSRNLTDDHSWDLALVLEGPLVNRQKAFGLNNPLGDFVAALPGLALSPVTDSVRQRAERMANELRRVDFAGGLPEPFEHIAFHPLGLPGYRTPPFPKKWDRSLVIAPFLDQALARHLSRADASSVLVSRAEELDRISSQSLQGFERVYVLAPTAQGDIEPEDSETGSAAGRPHGLHAKLFVFHEGWDSHVFVGSANATTAAFKRNVEFLVELVGKKSKVGVEQFLSGPAGAASLQNMLAPYEPPAEPADDSIERALDDLLNHTRMKMVTAGWELHAHSEGAELWHLSLERPAESALVVPAGVTVRIWPVTLPEDASAHTVEHSTHRVQFPEAGVGSLTSFLACDITAINRNKRAATRFALNLPLHGAPAGRREAILRLILDDPQKVLRFLQFLLNAQGLDPVANLGDHGVTLAAGTESDTAKEEVALLESLLRALAHDPDQLDEVASLLKELGEGAGPGSRLPNGLLQVWPPIWAAREALRK